MWVCTACGRAQIGGLHSVRACAAYVSRVAHAAYVAHVTHAALATYATYAACAAYATRATRGHGLSVPTGATIVHASTTVRSRAIPALPNSTCAHALGVVCLCIVYQ